MLRSGNRITWHVCGAAPFCICTKHVSAPGPAHLAALPLAVFWLLVAPVGLRHFAPGPALLVGVCPGASLAHFLCGVPTWFSSSSHLAATLGLRPPSPATRAPSPSRRACCLPGATARVRVSGCKSLLAPFQKIFSLLDTQHMLPEEAPSYLSTVKVCLHHSVNTFLTCSVGACHACVGAHPVPAACDLTLGCRWAIPGVSSAAFLVESCDTC